MNRIIVMKDDKSVMTDEDVDKVNELKYVLQVDKYDLVNDYNYYLENLYGSNYMELPPLEKRKTHNPRRIEF